MLGTALGHQGPAAARPSELTGHDGRPLHVNDIVPEQAAALGALEVQWVHPFQGKGWGEVVQREDELVFKQRNRSINPLNAQLRRARHEAAAAALTFDRRITARTESEQETPK